MAEHSRGEYWRGVIKRAVEAFAQGMLAALAIGYETFAKGGLPWLDAAYIGVGCAVIAVLVVLAGGQLGKIGSLLRGKAPPPEPPPEAS